VTQDAAREVYACLLGNGDRRPEALRDFIDENLDSGDVDRLYLVAGVFDFAAAHPQSFRPPSSPSGSW
jgi:hypothetical protein